MAARVAFIFGAVCGFLPAIVLLAFAFSSFRNFIAADIAAKDFQKYRAAVLHLPADAAERNVAVARLDALRKKTREEKISFLVWTSMSEKLDPLAPDCELTAQEWPDFLEGIESAEKTLGVPSPAPLVVPGRKKK